MTEGLVVPLLALVGLGLLIPALVTIGIVLLTSDVALAEVDSADVVSAELDVSEVTTVELSVFEVTETATDVGFAELGVAEGVTASVLKPAESVTPLSMAQVSGERPSGQQ